MTIVIGGQSQGVAPFAGQPLPQTQQRRQQKRNLASQIKLLREQTHAAIRKGQFDNRTKLRMKQIEHALAKGLADHKSNLSINEATADAKLRLALEDVMQMGRVGLEKVRQGGREIIEGIRQGGANRRAENRLAFDQQKLTTEQYEAAQEAIRFAQQQAVRERNVTAVEGRLAESITARQARVGDAEDTAIQKAQKNDWEAEVRLRADLKRHTPGLVVTAMIAPGPGEKPVQRKVLSFKNLAATRNRFLSKSTAPNRNGLWEELVRNLMDELSQQGVLVTDTGK